MLKTCSKCATRKGTSDFHRDGRRRGVRPDRGGMGVSSECKECRADRRKPGLAIERALTAVLRSHRLKQCGSCRRIKRFEDFHTRRASHDGIAFKCIDCVRAYLLDRRKANPDEFKEWYRRNVDHNSKRYKKYREANKEKVSQLYRSWAKNNPHKVRALSAKRNARKLNATPAWADQTVIASIYAEAVRLTRETGIKHEVDHIYPLQGRLVCGLHCEDNLQILTKVENIRKHNRMPEEFACAA